MRLGGNLRLGGKLMQASTPSPMVNLTGLQYNRPDPKGRRMVLFPERATTKEGKRLVAHLLQLEATIGGRRTPDRNYRRRHKRLCVELWKLKLMEAVDAEGNVIGRRDAIGGGG